MLLTAIVRVWVAGKTVWSHCYTHRSGPCLSALEIKGV